MRGYPIPARWPNLPLAMLLVLVLAPGTRVWGWGNTGHEAVAYVAWQHLNPSTRARVLVLLKRVPALDTPTGKTVAGYDDWVKALPPGLSKDKRDLFLFMRAATWADTIKHVGFTDSDVPPAGVTSDVNIGFTDKASHGYWHFVDKGFASDSSTVAHTPAPNAATSTRRTASHKPGSRAGTADSLITRTGTAPATSAPERGSCGGPGPRPRPRPTTAPAGRGRTRTQHHRQWCPLRKPGAPAPGSRRSASPPAGWTT